MKLLCCKKIHSSLFFLLVRISIWDFNFFYVHIKSNHIVAHCSVRPILEYSLFAFPEVSNLTFSYVQFSFNIFNHFMITYWVVHSIHTALKYKTSCSSQPETDRSQALVIYHSNPVIYDATVSWLIWTIWNSCSFVFLLSQTFKKCGLNFKTLYVSQQVVDRIHQLKLFICHCCKLLSGRGI